MGVSWVFFPTPAVFTDFLPQEDVALHAVDLCNFQKLVDLL